MEWRVWRSVASYAYHSQRRREPWTGIAECEAESRRDRSLRRRLRLWSTQHLAGIFPPLRCRLADEYVLWHQAGDERIDGCGLLNVQGKDLFAAQAFCRVCQGGLQGLITYGDQGDDDGH